MEIIVDLKLNYQITLKKYYINFYYKNPEVLSMPHITTSLAKGAKAVNTKNLKFEPLEEPIKVVGKFGY